MDWGEARVGVHHPGEVKTRTAGGLAWEREVGRRRLTPHGRCLREVVRRACPPPSRFAPRHLHHHHARFVIPKDHLFHETLRYTPYANSYTQHLTLYVYPSPPLVLAQPKTEKY